MIRVSIYPLSNSYYASQIYSGLFDLAASGEIALRYVAKPHEYIRERSWGKARNSRIAYIEIIDNDRNLIKVCYDMLDGPEIISLSGLEKCDVYFKRSYSREYTFEDNDIWEKDHPEWKDKVQPYGLNFPSSSQHEFHELRKTLIFIHANRLYRHHPAEALHMIARAVLRKKATINPLVEIPPETKAEPLILYQTRLFEPSSDEYRDEVENLNITRVNLVRALKKEFGCRFRGGLIPNKQTEGKYNDLLTSEDTSREGFFKLNKACLIVVFTRGKRQSTGWRLPEHLAMSRCIVSQPLAYQLPDPLVDGKNYILFNNPDECISACYKILTNEDLAQQMRIDNFNYYQNYVKPSSLIRNTIEKAISVAKGIRR